jgi:spermidine dehydrogenase
MIAKCQSVMPGERMARCDEEKPDSREAERLGLDTSIARRDFIGGALLGTGAALLTAAAPGAVGKAFADEPSKLPPVRGAGIAWRGTEIPDDWQGPGGVGDYAKSNGNTADVVRAAHTGVRNHALERKLASAIDTNEAYDLVIVGAGISGLFAAYDLLRQKPDAKVLILDNHAIFGGEAKHNQIDVDGYSLYAAQGPSIHTVSDYAPYGDAGAAMKILVDELGLPKDCSFTELTGTKKPLALARDYWTPQEQNSSQVNLGYFYESKGFIRDPFMNAFRDAPIDQKIKSDIAYVLLNEKRPVEPAGDPRAWLDTMTYEQFLQKVYGADPQAAKLLESDRTNGVTALGADVYSAILGVYGTQPYGAVRGVKGEYGIGFPTGNSGVARTLLKKFLPGAIPGDTLSALLFGSVNWDELDKASNNARIRLNATVVGVENNDSALGKKSVTTYYVFGGKLYRVKSNAVVMAVPQQVNRNVCFDLPSEYAAAMSEFHHPPILKVSVALRNWRFMEKADLTAFKWFGDFPAFGVIERKMRIDGRDVMPCDPSKPTILTLAIPMNESTRGLPLKEQAFAARHVLFALPFSAIELLVRQQFTRMFASYGFDAKRDIAGIVANRWGHALVCAGPGFFTGRNGAPPPSEVLKKPFERIAFSHSDLTGAQSWFAAARGARAAVANLVQRL